MSRIARRNTLKLLLAAPLVVAGRRAGAQQAWPSRAVQIILPFGPGGAADIMARIIFQRVSEILGQPMIVENRTGGNSIVAGQAVLGLPRDGHAYLMNGTNQITNPVLIENPPFDYNTAFVPVTQLCRYPLGFAVQYNSPIRTLEDFVAAAKANPGKLRYGTSPSGGMPHLSMEEFQRRAGIKLVHIPYRVAAEAPRDLMGGQLEMVIFTLSLLGPMMQSRQAHVLAVTTAERAKLIPDVPTIAERGHPGYEMGDWGGLFAPADVPLAIRQRMQAAVAQATRDPGVRGKLEPLGTEPLGTTAEEFLPFLQRQREILTRVIKEANVKLG